VLQSPNDPQKIAKEKIFMNDTKNPNEIGDDTIVTLEYTLSVNGEVIDSSEGGRPIQFIQGQQQIIKGLEDVLYGMSVGDSKEVVVEPEEGYGEVDPENFADIPRDQFPPEIPLEVGIELELKDQEGDLIDARIVSVDGENVRLDFNHPLAGEQLHFVVKVVGLREATEEELSHGHVHSEHSH
jgi:FKBP-type peptidyl-prolyl cis-trans isomerase SlyD